MISHGVAERCKERNGSGGKITHKTKEPEKAPTGQSKKSLTRRNEKSPSYYIQRGVSVVSEGRLKGMVSKVGYTEWTTQVRIEGLQLLLSYCLHRDKKNGFCMSAALAEQYVSEITKPKSRKTIRSPLALLCQIGLLVQIHPSVCSWHVMQSARYRLHPDFVRQRHPFKLSPRQQRKLSQFEARRESRLNQRYPIRKGITEALSKLSFAENARPKIVRLMTTKAAATNHVVEAIDCRKHAVTFDKVGQVRTTISSLPTELKSDLLLEGEEALFADLSHAHHCFLPRLVDDRIDHHRENAVWTGCFIPDGRLVVLFVAWNTQPGTVARLEVERLRLIEFLSSGDYYSKLGGEEENRHLVKKLANTVLNFPNEKAAVIPLYRSIRRKFPATFGIVEDIKQKDHRNISNPLRHYTAKSVEEALLELQAIGILVIPQTDALLCQRQHREAVCRAVGAAVFKVSGGVCSRVDDIRYELP